MPEDPDNVCKSVCDRVGKSEGGSGSAGVIEERGFVPRLLNFGLISNGPALPLSRTAVVLDQDPAAKNPFIRLMFNEPHYRLCPVSTSRPSIINPEAVLLVAHREAL
ncbi:hypothetical protein GWI33_005607 [Rhynchophorus ferrugineus]|uniref:Uncharacterized protein n=1 Tax=Rhynchophorus ferrugineus TaxID=354439 RepID=A0A834ILD1_RHYFE|nr:hypothetical protein GWI33_005607 [Rhynchophorus ferrugineus]